MMGDPTLLKGSVNWNVTLDGHGGHEITVMMMSSGGDATWVNFRRTCGGGGKGRVRESWLRDRERERG